MMRFPLWLLVPFVLAAACGGPPGTAGEQPSPHDRDPARSDVATPPRPRGEYTGLSFMPQRNLVPERQDTYRVVGHGVPVPGDLLWTSSNPDVASVQPLANDRAVVSGLREGRTVLTAHSRSEPARRAEHHLWVGPPIPFPPIPPREVEREGIRLRAETSLHANADGAPRGAMELRATVALTNETDRRRVLRLAECPLWLTGHMGGSHWDQLVHVHPPMWNQRRLPGACADGTHEIVVGPGQTHTLTTRVFAHEVMGDSLDVRDHHLHAHVALESGTVVLDAGSVELRYGIERWSARAATRLIPARGSAPDSLHVRATLINETQNSVRIEYGACAVHLHAYRTPDRTGTPVWRSERRAPWEAGYVYGCPAYLAVASVAPGGEFSPGEFALTVPLTEVLADSLPDGRYYFTAVLDAAGQQFRVAAGEVELRLARPPLPSRRRAHFLTFEANSRVLRAQPTTVRAEVTATLTDAGGSLVRFSPDCPVVLLAYRSRERRDAAPRSGAPDWQGPRECGDDLREIIMNRGQTQSFAVEASAGEILGGSLPPGRYYFAVAVQLERRQVFLAVGEADLRR
jgi:hypothetical protein